MNNPTPLEQRLLTEAMRHFETLSETPLNDQAANNQARVSGGDFEQRVMQRALALAPSQALHNAFQQLRSLTAVCLGGGIVLASLAGAAAARLTLQASTTEPLNFYWVLGSLMALPVLTLIVWLVLICIRPKTLSNGSLGGLLHGLGRRLLQRWHPDKIHIATAQASTTLFSPAAGGPWLLSTLSHAIWLAYLLGCLTLCIALLSVQQYEFGWQTTILSPETYIRLTTALGHLPSVLGFSTPDAAQIAASQWPGSNTPTLRPDSAWSGLLLGSLVVYGILPRALLLLLCWWLRRRRLRQFRLDIEQPEYARLRAQLMPQMERLGVVDPDDSSTTTSKPVTDSLPPPPQQGPIALLGLEIEQPSCGWPPLAHDDWLDLGLVDDRSSRQRALTRLQQSERPPRLIWVISSLALTPDRSSQNFLSQLRQQTNAPLLLTLSEGQRMRVRAREHGSSDDLAQRLDDWRTLASNAGIAVESVQAADLDHLTAVSRQQLSDALGLAGATSGPFDATQSGVLATAFNLIVAHSQNWRSYPDEAAQHALHRAISELFNAQEARQQLQFPSAETFRLDAQSELQRSAERFKNFLPARLQTQPRWLVAGALAGALGCATLATLTNPAVLAALPLWSLLGSALTALGINWTPAPEPAQSLDFFEPVSAAALFALVLSLQGREETTITHILDQTLDTSTPKLPDATAVQAWLATVSARLQQALAKDTV